MSSFFGEIIDKVSGSGGRSESEQIYESSSYGYNDHQPPPPGCPYPWRAIWHDRERRYYFVNQETQETVWEFEEVQRRTRGGGYYEQQSSTYVDERSTGGYGGGYGVGYSGYQQTEVVEEEKRRGGGGGHGLLYGAGGLVAGAALMYEGEKIHNDWEQDKYRVEEDKYRVENDVENFPENAAGWTGEKVGEVEGGFDRFGNSVEQRWDDAKYDVEDAPDAAAGWVGQEAGRFDRFGDNIDNAYDDGRAEGYYNDDRY